MSYVTIKEANNIKKALKENYKEIFKVHKEDDLSPVEKAVYKDYLFSKAFDVFEGDTYNKYEGEEKDALDAVLTKVNGEELNDENKAKALDTYTIAYANHEKHDKPKWYQLSKRFAYWMEARALKYFENKLMDKGVHHIEIEAAERNALTMLQNQNQKVDLNTYNSDYDLVTNYNKVQANVNLNEKAEEVNNDFVVDVPENKVTLKAMLEANA